MLAGFSDDDAQVIAQNSQMVDDFDFTLYWHCTNIPDYIKNNPDYDLCKPFSCINPAQTGFLCDGLLGYTDFVNLAIHRFQKFSCVPFHFIPQNRTQIGQNEYRVVPATLGNDSLISDMLEQAKAEYQAAADETTRHRKLMKIGVLLHIFADTVAHQMFSGYNANVNLVKLVNVINNITGRDETSVYRSYIQEGLKLLKEWGASIVPSIGHMMVMHVPDLTHLSFTMEYTGDDGQKHRYNRSNTTEFLKMSKVILDYLCDCLGSPRYEDERWGYVSEMFRGNFLIDISKDKNQHETVAHLKRAWQAPHACTYDYDGEAQKKAFAGETVAGEDALADRENGEEADMDFLPSAADIQLWGIDMDAYRANAAAEANRAKAFVKASDDFYNFNVIADEILINLYGPRPRN